MQEREVTDRAGAAVSRGAWQEALELLRNVRSGRPLSPPELDVLGHAAYGAGEFESAITAWEHAHRGYREAGVPVEAARAAVTVAMYLMMDTGLMAPVRGWTARAERLLAAQPECPVHAWLAMVNAYERLLSGDVPSAEKFAADTFEIGTRQGTPGPVAVAQVATARIYIIRGEVERGLGLLDEAAVAIVSGDLDPLTVGMIYCELICAMQGLAQYDRAEQWTEAMERWRRGNAFGGMNGRCRVHRAEILRLRGSCEEAETEALQACAELRPWMRREYGWPLTELGTIRLRRGDLAGAEEALLAAHECGWDPQPGLALLRLAQGDVATATELIHDSLAHPCRVPSKERPPYGALPRAPLLAAQVEIALAAGDPALASRAADELAGVAATYRSQALAAAAALARGQVALAADDPEGAARACDDAVARWSEIGAPYEAATARMALAEAHRARGQADRAVLELRAARSTFERLGADRKAKEAALAAGERVAGSVGAGSPVPASFRREGDLRVIEFAGRRIPLKDLKGMRYLSRLLAAPGREFHVLELVATEHAPASTGIAAADPELVTSTGDGAIPALDDQAVQAYRRRLRDIEDDLEEAERMGDPERMALARADRDFLVSELSTAFGLGGRERPTGSTAERARASVTRAVRYALARIAEHHQPLASHLRHTVHTGTYCSYTPDPTAPTSWRV